MTEGDEFVRGTISALGAATGDRFVVGAWNESPIGRFADVMWAAPDGTRTLLASSADAVDFVASIYAFEQTRVVPFAVDASPASLHVIAGPLEITAIASGGGRVPVPRPWWLTRFVEAPIARMLMGVETHGTSPRGVEEWYQARAWRWIRHADLRLDGVDLGPFGPATPPLGVGFSEPPPRASITDVHVRIRGRRRATSPD